MSVESRLRALEREARKTAAPRDYTLLQLLEFALEGQEPGPPEGRLLKPGEKSIAQLILDKEY